MRPWVVVLTQIAHSPVPAVCAWPRRLVSARMARALSLTSAAAQPRKPVQAPFSGSRIDSSSASRCGVGGSCWIKPRPFWKCTTASSTPSRCAASVPALRHHGTAAIRLPASVWWWASKAGSLATRSGKSASNTWAMRACSCARRLFSIES